MKITQASAMATEYKQGRWLIVIALNDEEGGPKGVRISLTNEHPVDYPSESAAAKTALEIIDGLHLENLTSEKFPVMHVDHTVVEETIPQEFKDSLMKLHFNSGRFSVVVGPKGEVRLIGDFTDSNVDKVFLWTLSPKNEYLPKSVPEAASLGFRLLRSLKLTDKDHGHHVVHHPDRTVIVDDQGSEVQIQ